MSDKCFFFAGGGTGGHIYPAVAVAEQIVKLEPGARIHFFCSTRSIDEQILKQTGFEFTRLSAKGFSVRPSKLIGFCTSFLRSRKIAKEAIIKMAGAIADSNPQYRKASCGDALRQNSVVTGVGGFVAAPVCWAAHKHKVPIALLNVDILPGRASKIIARWADEIFVQFEETAQYFAHSGVKVNVVGCPLRRGFDNPEPNKAIEQLGLEKDKKILLITGASSGSENINRAICSLLEKFDTFADDWQIVHLTGLNNYEQVKSKYSDAKISHKVLGYFDDMANLLAAADLVVGISGAVSVAEYAAASVPTICMPYPYHKDRHQYLNAGKLVEAGAAVIVDDLPDEKERSEWLWEELEELIKGENKRQQMAKACKRIANPQADLKMAEKLLKISR